MEAAAAQMFSTYPDEWPGVGLLLLRTAIGIVLMTRAASLLADWHDLRLAMAAIALLAAGGAILLLTGYLTRFGAILVALASAGGILFWSAAPGLGFLRKQTHCRIDWRDCGRARLSRSWRFFSRFAAFWTPGNHYPQISIWQVKFQATPLACTLSLNQAYNS